MEWINLDYVAYGVLGLVWLLMVTPVLGTKASDEWRISYIKALYIGFLLQSFIAVCSLIFFAIAWAVIRVLPWQ